MRLNSGAANLLGWRAEGGTGSDYQKVRNHILTMAAQDFFGPVLQDFSAPNLKILEERKKYHRFWKQAEVATENLLKDHWNEVEAIGNSLLENGDLSGKEVVRIIQ